MRFGIDGRAFEVIHLPAAEERAGDVPLLALAVGGEDEGAFLCADEDSTLLIGLPLVFGQSLRKRHRVAVDRDGVSMVFHSAFCDRTWHACILGKRGLAERFNVGGVDPDRAAGAAVAMMARQADDATVPRDRHIDGSSAEAMLPVDVEIEKVDVQLLRLSSSKSERRDRSANFGVCIIKSLYVARNE